MDRPPTTGGSLQTLVDRLRAVLAGRYAIERELGHGGMATVYLAHDAKHHRKVAVKVLRPELAVTLGADRFCRWTPSAAESWSMRSGHGTAGRSTSKRQIAPAAGCSGRSRRRGAVAAGWCALTTPQSLRTAPGGRPTAGASTSPSMTGKATSTWPSSMVSDSSPDRQLRAVKGRTPSRPDPKRTP